MKIKRARGKTIEGNLCHETCRIVFINMTAKSKFLLARQKMAQVVKMWHEWKQMFVSCMDKHAPRKLKTISKKRAPWITKGLLNKMHGRDSIKKKAISSNDHDMWEQFECARNQANNAIKQAEKRFFSDNLKVSKGNPRKTWHLINELTSRNTGKSRNILDIQVDNRTISSPGGIAEAFNDHFTNIGQVLAQEVPAAEVNPEFYLSHTDKAFHLKTPGLDVVFNLLRNIDEKKATGLDMIPSKLLKMAASIVTPSLTAIFTKSIITGIYPTEWKMARTHMGDEGSVADFFDGPRLTCSPGSVKKSATERLIPHVCKAKTG